jgi:hypothetical protein
VAISNRCARCGRPTRAGAGAIGPLCECHVAGGKAKTGSGGVTPVQAARQPGTLPAWAVLTAEPPVRTTRGDPAIPATTQCPYCRVDLRVSWLEEHKRERCPNRPGAAVTPPAKPTLPIASSPASTSSALPSSWSVYLEDLDRRPEQLWVKCLLCSHCGPPSKIRRHLTQKHVTPLDRPPREPAARPATATCAAQQRQDSIAERCSRCGCPLLADDRAAHLQVCAGRTPLKPDIVPAVPPEWSRCPFCDTKVKSAKLEQHRRTCMRRTKQVAASARRDDSPRRTPEWITTVSLDARTSDERRDASHGWGQRYREHGRFGSHPSHDSFDDESEP